MPTKGLISRERIGNRILQATRIHAREVGERLNEQLRFTVAEDETFADYVDLQKQMARLLQSRLDELVAAEALHLGEVDDDGEPRLLRRQASDALYRKLVELREFLRGIYGIERANALVGISGDTPGDPVTLHRQAVSVLERLREPGPALPPQRFGSVQYDRNALADELQPFVDELGAVLQDIEREVRERETSKRLRDEALASFDSTARAVARIQMGLDELAGFPRYAERIRLTLPSRRRGPGEGEETSEGEDESPEAQQPPDDTEEELAAADEADGLQIRNQEGGPPEKTEDSPH